MRLHLGRGERPFATCSPQASGLLCRKTLPQLLAVPSCLLLHLQALCSHRAAPAALDGTRYAPCHHHIS